MVGSVGSVNKALAADLRVFCKVLGRAVVSYGGLVLVADCCRFAMAGRAAAEARFED